MKIFSNDPPSRLQCLIDAWRKIKQEKRQAAEQNEFNNGFDYANSQISLQGLTPQLIAEADGELDGGYHHPFNKGMRAAIKSSRQIVGTYRVSLSRTLALTEQAHLSAAAATLQCPPSMTVEIDDIHGALATLALRLQMLVDAPIEKPVTIPAPARSSAVYSLDQERQRFSELNRRKDDGQ